MRDTKYKHISSVETKFHEVCHFSDRLNWTYKPIKPFDVNDAKLLALGLSGAVGLKPKALVEVCRTIPLRAKKGSQRKFLAGLEKFFSETGRSDLQSIVDDHGRARSRQQLSYSLCATDKWRPTLKIEGRDSLDKALSKGRGVILWVESFLSHVVVGKRSLHDNDVAISHLSVPTHGFPETKFGRYFHHRRQVRIENKYIDDRIVFDPSKDSPRERIAEVLRQGKIILITNNAFAGRRIINLPLDGASRFDIAAGPISLALKNGAALLPMATVEIQPLSEYTTAIGPDITDLGGRHSDDPICNTAMNYRDWLAPLIREHPEQWVHWARIREGASDPRSDVMEE